MKKRITALLLAAVMLLAAVALAGCGGGKVDPNGKPASGALTTKSLTGVYKAEAVPVIGTVLEKLELNNVTDLGGGRLIVMGYDRNNGYEAHRYITDTDFKTFSELPVTKNDASGYSTDIGALFAGPDGSIWYFKNVWYYPEDGEDGEAVIYNDAAEPEAEKSFAAAIDSTRPEIAVEGDESRNWSYLVKVGPDGNIALEKDVTELIADEDGERGYVQNVVFAGDRILMNVNGSRLLSLDPASLEKVNEKAFEEYMDGMFLSSKGNVYFTVWGGSGIMVKSVDPVSLTVSDVTVGNPAAFYDTYSFRPGGSRFDFVYADNNGIYGLNMADAEPTEICNYMNSDLDINYGASPVLLEDGRILLAYYNYNENENEVLMLSPVDPADLKEKYIINVGALWIDSQIKSAFMKFNRTSDEYKIIITDYSKYNNESNDWNGGAEQLDRDILSRTDAPDIILFDGWSLDPKKYTSKNIFADLYAFMDADDTFDRADYLENVFKAGEDHGKLYTISPTVTFMTLAGKKELFGDKTGWTMNDFFEMYQGLGEGEMMFREETRDGVGNMLLQLAVMDFIDESGKCHFDSEDFKNILRYLKELPADYSAYEEYWNENPNYWTEQELALSKGTTKLNSVYIGSFDILPRLEAQFGGPVNLIGYPNPEGTNGIVMNYENAFAINTASKVQSVAWQALKTLFADEYQNKFAGDADENGGRQSSYAFPIKKSIIEKKKANDLLPQYYTYRDENGEMQKEEYDNTYWIGEEEIKLRKSTAEDADLIYDLILKADKAISYAANDYSEIITQAAQPFYDGQKSVDEVCTIINSQIQLKVNE